MAFSEFRKAGHPATLFSGFFSYFDVSFMVWVILVLSVRLIRRGISPQRFTKRSFDRCSATGRCIFWLILGWMTERFGGRRTSLIGLGLTLIPLILAWKFADGFAGFIGVGLLLGVAGASLPACIYP